MHTQINKILIFISLFFTFQYSYADELVNFVRKVAGFVDYTNQNHLFFLSESGQADWFNPNTGERIVKFYKITDSKCFTTSQNPMSMDGSDSGLTLAYPFLVGLGKVCVIDDTAKEINFAGTFALPENPYSIVFAGHNSDYSYFIINSKSMLEKSGSLHLVSINKKNLSITTKLFSTGVPGYSGAMLYDQGNLWVSTWPQKIYKISALNLEHTVKSSVVVQFNDIAQVSLHNGMGMSLFVLKNENSLLYYNNEYDHYTVSLLNDQLKNVTPPCLPVSGFGNQWLVLCNQKSLHTWQD